MKTIRQQLYKLQQIQEAHDEKYHKDISNLNLHHRLNHLVLHFAKYSGRFFVFELNKEKWCNKDLRKLITDTFIIGLSACNTLNVYLDKTIAEVDTASDDLYLLGQELNKSIELENVDVFKQFAIYVGKMAKACESLDHLEDIKFRDIMIENVIDISCLTLILAYRHKVNLYTDVQIRLNEVEDKSIF